MRLVHTSPNTAQINHLRSILESIGIECRVRGEFLAVAVGELPPIECWSELWIADDDRFDDAMDLVRREGGSSRAVAEPWRCPSCHESVDANFTECWSCGHVVEILSDVV